MGMHNTGLTLWGDGFVDDPWRDTCRVSAWDAVDPDEYVCFFPRLVPAGDPPSCLVRHLDRVVAALSRRADRGGTCGAGDEVAAFRSVDWIWRDEARRLLRTVLTEIEAGAPTPFDDDRAAWFAFFSGLHPASFWASAAIAHERFGAAGWLGVVSRGRPALMPWTVASTLVDLIDAPEGRPIGVHDAVLASMIGGNLHALHRAACERLAGEEVVVPPATRRALAGRALLDLRVLTPWLRRAGVVFRPGAVRKAGW